MVTDRKHITPRNSKSDIYRPILMTLSGIKKYQLETILYL